MKSFDRYFTIDEVEPIDPNYFQHQLVFLVGIFIQAFRMIPTRNHWKTIFFLALVAIGIGLIPGKHEEIYDLHFHLWEICFIYVFILFPFFSRYLLSRLTEFDVILQTVYAWAIIVFGPWGYGTLQPYISYISVFMTLILLYIILPIQHGTKREVLVYMWMPFLSVTMMIFYIPTLITLPFYQPLTPLSTPQTFSVGMTGFLFIRNILTLFYCFPMKGKRETWEEALRQWREYLAIVRDKMDDRQINPLLGLVLSAILIAAVVALETRSPGASTYYLPLFLSVTSVVYEARTMTGNVIQQHSNE